MAGRLTGGSRDQCTIGLKSVEQPKFPRCPTCRHGDFYLVSEPACDLIFDRILMMEPLRNNKAKVQHFRKTRRSPRPLIKSKAGSAACITFKSRYNLFKGSCRIVESARPSTRSVQLGTASERIVTGDTSWCSPLLSGLRVAWCVE